MSPEIARLRNSLSYLQSTQEQLREALAESPDFELSKAMEENEVTIGSQEERISILRMALAEKGIPTEGHYALDPATAVPPSRNTPAATPRAAQSESPSFPRQPTETRERVTPAAAPSSRDVEMDEDGGLHL